MRLFFRISLYIILSLLVICLLLILFSQTSLFKNWLRDLLTEEINKNLAATIQIENISGNIFNKVNLSNIFLVTNHDTLIHINKLELHYNLIALLEKKIYLKKIDLQISTIHLYQTADSSWNVTKIIPPKAQTDSMKKDTTKIFPFEIFLDDFRAKIDRVNIESFRELIPREIHEIHLNLSATISETSQKFHLQQFSFQTVQPDISVRNLAFLLQLNDQNIALKDFELRLLQSNVVANVLYNIEESDTSGSLRLEAKPVDLNEIDFLLPSLNLPRNPIIALETEFDGDSLNLLLKVKEKDQEIILNAMFCRFTPFSQFKNLKTLQYKLDGSFRNFNIGHLMEISEKDYILNGMFHLNGHGIDPRYASGKLRTDFSKTILNGYYLDRFNIEASYNKGDGAGQITVAGPFGYIDMQTKVNDIFRKKKYHLKLNVSKLNLAKLFLDDSLQSDLNFSLEAAGKGFNFETTAGNLAVQLSTSELREISLDTLWCQTEFIGQDFQIEYLNLILPHGEITLNGKVSLQKENALDYRIQMEDFSQIQKLLPNLNPKGQGSIVGRVEGNLDSLSNVSTCYVQNFSWNNVACDYLNAQVNMIYADQLVSGDVEGEMGKISLSGFQLDTTSVKAQYTEKRVDISFYARHSSKLAMWSSLSVALDSIIQINIPEMVVSINNQKWIAGGPDTYIILAKDNYAINNLQMKIPDMNEFFFNLDGEFSFSDDENISLELAGLRIDEISKLLNLPVRINGELFLNTKIEGTAKKPVIDGGFEIRNGQFDRYTFQFIKCNYRYCDGVFSWGILLSPDEEHELIMEGNIPMVFSFADNIYRLEKSKPVNINIKTDGLPLGIFLVGISDLKEVNGIMVCNLDITNTLNFPHPKGYLTIQNGAIKIPAYGINYSNFEMSLTADTNRVILDKLRAQQQTGYIEAKGIVNLSENLISGKINTTQFQLTAKNFYITKHKNYQVQISADTQLKGTVDSAKYSGLITVQQSSFTLPSMMEIMGDRQQNRDISLPLLVEATAPYIVDTTVSASQVASKPNTISRKFLENLTGDLTIFIPRNSWIKSPNILIEIEGNLDVVKEGKDFELFGKLDVIRGNFDVIGKRFNIIEGTLKFNGGREFNPEIVVESRYEFRSREKEKMFLDLNLSGELKNPSLNFTLDGRKISEADALSYILFGISSEELSYGQQSTLTGNVLAMDVASSLISNRLSKVVGQDLNLDYIELKAKDNWQTATFLVGKYITNELFVSYEREFGESNDTDVAPETITVEYELTPKIFLQLIEGDSKAKGFDMIFKLERE